MNCSIPVYFRIICHAAIGNVSDSTTGYFRIVSHTAIGDVHGGTAHDGSIVGTAENVKAVVGINHIVTEQLSFRYDWHC